MSTQKTILGFGFHGRFKSQENLSLAHPWGCVTDGTTRMSLATNLPNAESTVSTPTALLPRPLPCILILLAFLLAPCGVINHGDGLARYAQTKALLLYHRWSIPPELAFTKHGEAIGGILKAPNGQLYSKYGVGTSLVWLLPTSIAWIIQRTTGANLDNVAGAGISLVNPALVAGTTWSLLYALRRLDVGQRERFFTILLYLFGTSAPAYANTAFSEPLAALLLFWAVLLSLIRRGFMAAGISGLLLTSCTLVKPELTLLPACLLPLYLWHQRGRALLTFCLTSSLGLFFLALDNLVCRGSPMSFSYANETSQFQWPGTAMLALFYGMDRNLFLYNPALLLAITGWLVKYRKPQWQRLSVTCLSVWVVYLFFYSSWHAWEGGWCFGPRFFQSFIPVALLPSGVGLSGLLANAGRRLECAFCGAVFCGLVLLSLPLQMAGLCVKNEEVVLISEITGQSETWTQIRLMTLKLERGIRHPEIYHQSDFMRLDPREFDTVMDFQAQPLYQYLNHWWSIYLANRLRYPSSPGQ